MARTKHRIIDSKFGEICLKEKSDGYCEVYIGDNYDDYVGDVQCTLEDSDEVIFRELDYVLN